MRLSSRDRRLAAVTEIGVLLAFYQWYSVARHWVAGSETAAYAHALQLIRIETSLGIYNEAGIHAWVLARRWLVQTLSLHYAVFHFVVPVVALIILFRRCPGRYLAYRNALAWMSVLAVVTFWLWPLMPPRLLPGSYGFVDVFATRFRPPAVDHGFAPALYNGFAAMPSLHVAYALWCVVALWPVLRSNLGRLALLGHLSVTIIAVVGTANHYHLDAVGGAAVLAGGVLLGRRRRLPRIRSRAGIAAAGLVAAAVFIWMPKAEPLLVAENVLVAAVLMVTARLQPPGRQPSQKPALAIIRRRGT